MTHPCLPGQLAQRQLIDALMAQGGLGGSKQRLAQPPVMVGALVSFGHDTSLDDVGVDNLVVSGYIVDYDYFLCCGRA